MTLTQAPPPDAAGEIVLLPCPFCGCDVVSEGPYGASYAVECEGCGANVVRTTLEAVRATWNTRTITPTDPLRSLSVGEEALVEAAAKAAWKADFIDGESERGGPTPDGFDFEWAWNEFATMPLSGPGFVRKWTAIGKAVLALSQSSAAQARGFAEGLKHAVQVCRQVAGFWGQEVGSSAEEAASRLEREFALSQGSGSTDGGAA